MKEEVKKVILKNAAIIGLRRHEDSNPNKSRNTVYVTYPSQNISGLGTMSFSVYDWQAKSVCPDLAIMDDVDIVFHNEKSDRGTFPVLDYLITKR